MSLLSFLLSGTQSNRDDEATLKGYYANIILIITMQGDTVKLFTNDPEASDNSYSVLQRTEIQNLARVHFEELYAVTKDILDKKFIQQCKYDLHSCYAEMYFAATIKVHAGYDVTHPSDTGADFFVPKICTWLEVVALTNGDEGTQHSIPKSILGELSSYPEEQIILRMSGAFSTKSKKMTDDINKGLISPSQPIVICISGCKLEERVPMYPENGYPQIVKALLPVGDTLYWKNIDSGNITISESKYRESVIKNTNTKTVEIKTDFFLYDCHSHISAVIYSSAYAGNPVNRELWGADFHIVHNPNATNPLPQGFIKRGTEYLIDIKNDSFSIDTIRHNNKD